MSMQLDVNITQHPENPEQQVVTFTPPVASWSVTPEHTLDALWKELTWATSALLSEQAPDKVFDAVLQQALRTRILTVVLYWVSQGWVTLDAVKEKPASLRESSISEPRAAVAPPTISEPKTVVVE